MARYRQVQGKELGMRNIREVLRLGLACGVGSRDIGRSLRISHSSAQKYTRLAREAGLGEDRRHERRGPGTAGAWHTAKNCYENHARLRISSSRDEKERGDA